MAGPGAWGSLQPNCVPQVTQTVLLSPVKQFFRFLSQPKKVELRVLAGEVWVCLGSDNMALPMAGLQDAAAQIQQSLNFSQVASSATGHK